MSLCEGTQDSGALALLVKQKAFSLRPYRAIANRMRGTYMSWRAALCGRVRVSKPEMCGARHSDKVPHHHPEGIPTPNLGYTSVSSTKASATLDEAYHFMELICSTHGLLVSCYLVGRTEAQ